jgi:hypothetical protein
MTERERNLIREAIACTRHELGDRVAPPGPQDAWRGGPRRAEVVQLSEAQEIRAYVRAAIARNHKAMRKFGKAA